MEQMLAELQNLCDHMVCTCGAVTDGAGPVYALLVVQVLAFTCPKYLSAQTSAFLR